MFSRRRFLNLFNNDEAENKLIYLWAVPELTFAGEGTST